MLQILGTQSSLLDLATRAKDPAAYYSPRVGGSPSDVAMLFCDMMVHVGLERAMQQSPARRVLGLSPIWALVWALVMFIFFMVVMAWSMSR